MSKRKVKVEEIVKGNFDALMGALNERAAHQRNAGNETQAQKWEIEAKQITLPVVEKCAALGIDFAALAAQIKVTDMRSGDFLAIYAMQKVRRMLVALATGIKNEIDPYSDAIVKNVVKLGQVFNKSAMVALSRSIEFTETEQTQAVIRARDCSPSTASTQASSTRMMLRALNLCNVVKGKQGDSISFKENDAVSALKALYGVESDSDESESE